MLVSVEAVAQRCNDAAGDREARERLLCVRQAVCMPVGVDLLQPGRRVVAEFSDGVSLSLPNTALRLPSMEGESGEAPARLLLFSDMLVVCVSVDALNDAAAALTRRVCKRRRRASCPWLRCRSRRARAACSAARSL